jgi:hypothetical protein
MLWFSFHFLVSVFLHINYHTKNVIDSTCLECLIQAQSFLPSEGGLSSIKWPSESQPREDFG